MKKKAAALYDPYLDTLGGGEKHILSILKVLEDEGCNINIFWDENLQAEIESKLDLDFSFQIPFYPNIFKPNSSFFKKFRTLKKFDYFFYVTDGSYFFSRAKHNFVFCMVPKKELYSMDFLNRFKTQNFTFIANSKFTQAWLSDWGIKASVIYPYLSSKFINTEIPLLKKKEIILSVGRFFSHLHSKQQIEIVEAFKKLKEKSPAFRNFKLVLAGGFKKEDLPYLDKLRQIAKNDPSIILKPNISFTELFKLYQEASFFWHFTGFGVDDKKTPELVEHLGMTPMEAMATGCITFCYQAGGPKELIQDGKNGFLFTQKEELFRKMSTILKDNLAQRRIQKAAQTFVRENFSYGVFKRKVKEIILSPT